MQGMISSLNAIVGIIGFAFGLAVGYKLGARNDIRLFDRMLYIFILTMFSGVMAYLLTSIMLSLIPYDMITALLASFGGCIIGTQLNWRPTEQIGPRRRVTFDPEEDDEMFDQQIRKILDADT